MYSGKALLQPLGPALAPDSIHPQSQNGIEVVSIMWKEQARHSPCRYEPGQAQAPRALPGGLPSPHCPPVSCPGTAEPCPPPLLVPSPQLAGCGPLL